MPDDPVLTPAPRGRRPRLPDGERLRRVVVYVGADTEFPRLLAAAQLNQQSVSEYLRDAGNDAAEDCGAPAIFVERRTAERRTRRQVVPVDRRRAPRREEG